MAEIPHILVEQVRDGNVVLVLGAGAAKGAIHPRGDSPPDGPSLARMLAEKFLGTGFTGRPLDQVADLAISEADLVTVQEFVADILRPFQPAPFHEQLPTFRWSAIATTNYDLIIERAYERQTDRRQELVPFTKNGEHIEQRLRTPDSLVYLKLHGCVTRTTDPEIPLILTPEQYITHRANRSRLFERLEGLAHEQTLVFVGHSLSDVDLRQILLEISDMKNRMPRSYLVAPFMTDADVRFWENRKMAVIKSTFETFIQQLSTRLPPHARKLSMLIRTTEHPICKRLRLAPGAPLPARIDEYLNRSAEYVHGAIAVEPCVPAMFYKGHFDGWPEILANLDVHRRVTDTILSETVLPTETERTTRQDLIVLRGHAGSGKTVTLYRVAWESATALESICLFLRDGGELDYDVLHEIWLLAKQRLFLFVDSASKHRDSILSVMRLAQRDQLPLTLVTSERHNEWSAYCEPLEPYVTRFYSTEYLSESEIDELIQLLARHKSLGYLESMTQLERHQALAQKAGRHLLVALHEATLGRPFSDIIFHEYTSIPDPVARTLYRTVCVLHRLGIPVRAGLIARVHGIPLSQFRESLFRPLEEVVFARKPDGASDYYYRSRHPHIADIVFERSLLDPRDRLDEYLRIVGFLDVDYESDRRALRGLVHAKKLAKLFPDADMARRVFAVAHLRDPGNPSILQQEALLEKQEGLHEEAYELLQKAMTIQPHNAAIQHTLAELSLARSETAAYRVETIKYRNDARTLAKGIISRGTRDSYAFHTLLKIGLYEVEETLESSDSATFATALRDFEKLLATALQRHPDDSHILDIEAKCAELLNNRPQGLASLKRAFAANKQSAYIASRLAKLMADAGDVTGAMGVLREALDNMPGEKELHFRLAMLIPESEPDSRSTLIYHLRSSFTEGDSRYVAQFWYARAQFLYGDAGEAQSMFRVLADVDADRREKSLVRGPASAQRFHGAVDRIESSYAFVRRDGDRARIFVRPDECENGTWERLRRGRRVRFALRFNFFGPVAVNLTVEGAFA